MYKAYNLTITEAQAKTFSLSSATLVSANKTKVRRNIRDFFSSDSVDAEALEREWFGIEKPHIFLSHSHKDLDLAAGLSEMLWERFGITCFVDSFVWGYCDELLNQIDKKFCLSQAKVTFDYQKRNRSTSHVHMMLSAALAKVMDHAECIIFLNTPNSIITKDFIGSGKVLTASPWIYNELLLTRLLKSRPPRRVLEEAMTKSLAKEDLPPFHFSADVDHLIDLSASAVKTWLNCGKTGTDALDFLYNTHF